MTKTTNKIRTQVMEMEQAADIALAAVEAEDGVGADVKSAVTRLHDYARQAKQTLLAGSEGRGTAKDDDAPSDDDPDETTTGADVAALRAAIAAAEEAADQALEEVDDDVGVGKATKAAIEEAHKAAKKAKDLF